MKPRSPFIENQTYIKTSDCKLNFQKLTLASEILLVKGRHDLSLWSKNQLLFCFKVILKTIEACKNKDYTQFDAQTTTGCCHGIALFTSQLIKEINYLNLDEIHAKCVQVCLELQKENDLSKKILCSWFLPKPLIELSKLFILYSAKETDSNTKAFKTVVLKLQNIFPLSKEFFRELVAGLQTYISNLVAHSYYAMYNKIENDVILNGIPLKLWAKYVSPDYIKKDKRGRLYAASLYSMQIVLAELIYSKSKLALVNELRDEEDNFIGRFIQIMQGDGVSRLTPVNYVDLINENSALSYDEPIIIYGGCAISNTLNEQSLGFKMGAWINRFTELVLAHETSYPQFPRVNDDPDFDCSPINPDEDYLKKILLQYSELPGFSLKNPSLCCLAHIYTASLKQVVSSLQNKSKQDLPFSHLPKFSSN